VAAGRREIGRMIEPRDHRAHEAVREHDVGVEALPALQPIRGGRITQRPRIERTAVARIALERDLRARRRARPAQARVLRAPRENHQHEHRAHHETIVHSHPVARVLVALVLLSTFASADHLTPDDLARKNEDGYVTGLPLVAYSTDIGLGGGARAYYYWNGKRTDARFAVTPYLHRVFLQAFFSTRGIQFHWLDYDAPRIFGTPYRVRSQLIYGRNIVQNYFG